MSTQTLVMCLVCLLALLLGRSRAIGLPEEQAAAMNEGADSRYIQVRRPHAQTRSGGEYWIRAEYAWLIVLPVLWMSCMDHPRGDVHLYLHNYRNLSTTFGGYIANLAASERSGIGFLAFEGLIAVLTNGSETVFRVCLVLAQMIPIVAVMRKYSPDYGFTVFLFMAMGCHLGWLMNGVRQFLAVAMIFATTPWQLQRKYMRVVVMILLASLVHTSAIIMLPIVFIASGKAWNGRTLLYISLSVIGAYLFSRVDGLFDAILVNTEYAGTMTSMQAMGDDGVNPIRVLVSAVPAALAIYGRRQIDTDKDPVMNICINMSLITVGINLIAMVTSGIMVGRLAIYTSMYSFILLPYCLAHVFRKQEGQMITVISVICYLGYYYIECGL